MSKYGRYFASDPNWDEYTKKHPEYALKTDPSQVQPLDIPAGRASEAVYESQWSEEHPLESFGYTARFKSVTARDGFRIPIKVYHPLQSTSRSSLPLFFVTHGGGWTQGTAVTEELWLLCGVLQSIKCTIVSVEYRLAPEHTYPTYVHDSWDALQEVVKRSGELEFDAKRIFLAGTSAGGALAAMLSQSALRTKLPIHGVMLNVPMTCHPKYFPVDQYEYTSYNQCLCTVLASSEMYEIWEAVVPDVSDGKNPDTSPLLGDVAGLLPHLVFIACQYSLRDEGLAYVEKLERNGVKVKLHVYQGVPHDFATIEELEMTQKFKDDLGRDLKIWLA